MNKSPELILAIESSCDETSVAVVKDGHEILSNIVASQIKSHQRFGGVVPEVASRHHVEQITLCLREALAEAQVTPAELSAVAVTYGPGLVGSLLIGLSAAKAFAWAHGLPLIPVNHMAGHIYAARFVAPLEFPLMALLVSGGHTELVYMKADGEYEIIGQTRDDAAGEAYDKVGRVLGLTYPSGKEIDQLAHEGALKEYPVKQLIVAGGVAANQGLRVGLTQALAESDLTTELLIPPLRLCGDNGAMIGAAAHVQLQKGDFADLSLNADPSLSFPEMA